ncbi:MAG: hypothetical protein NTV46_11575 [Verrucomicrobia bacterium]|nr:hypothetical protein [Verrucomicrobiota bacterium]
MKNLKFNLVRRRHRRQFTHVPMTGALRDGLSGKLPESIIMITKRIFIWVALTLACGTGLSGTAVGAVVMEQIGDATVYNFETPPGPLASQLFPDFPDYDCSVLDDFTVTTDFLTITRIAALFSAQAGFASFLNVQNYTVYIFSADNLATGNLTANVACVMQSTDHDVSVVEINHSDQYGLVNLVVNIALPTAGTYWVGVTPKSSVPEDKFFLLNNGATGAVTTGNANAQLANPGLGFGVGALSLLKVDAAYTVTVVPEPAAITLWIAGGCALLCRRRRARHATHHA